MSQCGESRSPRHSVPAQFQGQRLDSQTTVNH